jgi:hypothetical protein
VSTEDLASESNLSQISQRLLKQKDLPEFEPKDLTLDALFEEGERLVYEVRICPCLLHDQDSLASRQPSLHGIAGLCCSALQCPPLLCVYRKKAMQ